jgi:hypothetical protein
MVTLYHPALNNAEMECHERGVAQWEQSGWVRKDAEQPVVVGEEGPELVEQDDGTVVPSESPEK